jgi:hypothetical protein
MTALATAAASLSAGQSVSFGTIATNVHTYGSEGANFVQWGHSMVYDPTRRQVSFIGKRDASNPYHWLVYDEATNAWTNTRAVWSTSSYLGHGYDQNAIDPATGTHYFRSYGDNAIHVWNGSWSTLTSIPYSTEIIGGLTWFPGVGLIYNDGKGVRRYSGGAWSSLASYSGDTYTDFSEYNSTANAMIFSANGSYYKMTSDLTISSIATPPFTISVSKTAGLAVSDPRSGNIIAYNRSSPYEWARYNFASNTWSSIPSGYPSIPTAADQFVNACSIPLESGQYGVMMFIKAADGQTGTVYLYRYS